MTSENKAGRYELLEELGRGAMGVVWKGYDPTIGRTVAVKTMKLTEEGSGLPRPDLVARFQTETRAAGLLTHPSIVVIYDAGEDAHSGLFYITMEYIQGQSLQIGIDKRQAFPIPRVMKLMEQACQGLGYAHQHNVVHRDVKPANLMLAPDDTLKITDFGMAKILQLGTTQTGQIVGTPSYMSPEQVKGKPIDGRSDIFSLGVVLYELVTGEKPFPGQNVTTVIYKIVHEEPISPLELDSSIHPGLSKVISKALAKDPDERYQTCIELLEELRRYRDIGVRDMSKTVVVVGKSQQLSPFAAQPPRYESSGTLAGVPMPEIPQAPPEPPRPPVTPTVVMPPPTPPAPTAQTVAAAPQRQQSPTVRSGTSLPPLPYTPAEAKPEKKSGHTWLVFVLLVLIGAGGYLLWPTLQPLVESFRTQPAAPAQTVQPAPTEATKPPEKPPEAAETKPAETTKAPEPKPADVAPPPTKAESKAEPKAEDALALQKKIEQRIERAGFGGRVRVDVNGQTVRLSGSLKAADKRRVLQAFRQVQGRNRLDDQIEVASAGGGDKEELKTSPGMGEIEVVTDVLGAKAALKGPDGQTWEHETPWRFEDLPPGRYTLTVTHPSYRPINRILQVRAGHVTGEPLTMQPYASGILVTSRPAQAEVFINGKRHSGLTPTTVKLAPGNYAVRVAKEGFEGAERSIELKGDSLAQMDVQLAERPRGVGYIDVRTVPLGADILVDGNDTGRDTPFVIQLPPGRYTITLFLKGYPPVRKQVVVEPNKTISLNEVLR